MARLSRSDFQHLADTWRAWDEAPGERGRVIALSIAIRVIADDFGMTPTEVREWMTHRRRAGLTVGQVVTELVRGAMAEAPAPPAGPAAPVDTQDPTTTRPAP